MPGLYTHGVRIPSRDIDNINSCVSSTDQTFTRPAATVRNWSRLFVVVRLYNTYVHKPQYIIHVHVQICICVCLIPETRWPDQPTVTAAPKTKALFDRVKNCCSRSPRPFCTVFAVAAATPFWMNYRSTDTAYTGEDRERLHEIGCRQHRGNIAKFPLDCDERNRFAKRFFLDTTLLRFASLTMTCLCSEKTTHNIN